MSLAKTAEAIKVPFASTTLVGPGKHLLHIAYRFGRILYCVHSTQYSLLVKNGKLCISDISGQVINSLILVLYYCIMHSFVFFVVILFSHRNIPAWQCQGNAKVGL